MSKRAIIRSHMANQERANQSKKEQAVWKEHTKASASASVFLSDSEGRILLVQDVDAFGGKWSPVGGFVDVAFNEEPEIAALREAKEELDLDVRLDELIGVWHYYTADDEHTVSYGDDPKSPSIDKAHMHIGYSYRGTILGGTFTMQKNEIQNYGFFAEPEFRQMIADGKIKSPQYIAVGYDLWKKGTRHPLNVVQTNSKV